MRGSLLYRSLPLPVRRQRCGTPSSLSRSPFLPTCTTAKKMSLRLRLYFPVMSSTQLSLHSSLLFTTRGSANIGRHDNDAESHNNNNNNRTRHVGEEGAHSPHQSSRGPPQHEQTSASSSSHSSSSSKEEWTLQYSPRWRYAAPFRTTSLSDYVVCREKDLAVAIARTYSHPQHGVTVTLVPLRHLAHPNFFAQVDALCGQHQSVLMEGRTPLTGAPYSTLVPPRDAIPLDQRPLDLDEGEGWEPHALEEFFQPFSWGVRDTPAFTVIHAADKYDYERLPWYCSLRFNIPLLGGLAREQHCLNMIPPLRRNGYTSFAVPWGAAHMPIFHEMLLENGFEPVGMCSLLILNRADGDRSEGELMRLQSAERRRARRVHVLYAVGVMCLLSLLSRFFEMEITHGPSQRRVHE